MRAVLVLLLLALHNCAAWDAHAALARHKKHKDAVRILRGGHSAHVPSAKDDVPCAGDASKVEKRFCTTMLVDHCRAWTKSCPCTCAGVEPWDPNKVVWVGKKPANADELERDAAALRKQLRESHKRARKVETE